MADQANEDQAGTGCLRWEGSGCGYEDRHPDEAALCMLEVPDVERLRALKTMAPSRGGYWRIQSFTTLGFRTFSRRSGIARCQARGGYSPRIPGDGCAAGGPMQDDYVERLAPPRLGPKAPTCDEPLDEISFFDKDEAGFWIAVWSMDNDQNGPLSPRLRNLRSRTTQAMAYAHAQQRCSTQIPVARKLITTSSTLQVQAGAACHQGKDQAMIWDAGSEFGVPG